MRMALPLTRVASALRVRRYTDKIAQKRWVREAGARVAEVYFESYTWDEAALRDALAGLRRSAAGPWTPEDLSPQSRSHFPAQLPATTSFLSLPCAVSPCPGGEKFKCQVVG